MVKWSAIVFSLITSICSADSRFMKIIVFNADQQLLLPDEFRIYENHIEISTVRDARGSSYGSIGKFILSDKTAIELMKRSAILAKEESHRFQTVPNSNQQPRHLTLKIDGAWVENEEAVLSLLPILKMIRNHPSNYQNEGKILHFLPGPDHSLIKNTLKHGKVIESKITSLVQENCHKVSKKIWECTETGNISVLISE